MLGAAHEAFPDAALLHGASRLESDSISDIDLVVADASTRMPALVDALKERDLEIVMVWPYDVNSVTLLIASPMMEEGAQLDLLDDVPGIGKYGLFTDVALSQSSLGRVSDLDSWLYSVQKRITKRQLDRAMELAQRIPVEPREVGARAAELLRRPQALMSLLELDTTHTSPRSLGPIFPEVRRLVRRLLLPVGWAVHLEDHTAADQLEVRLRRFVPHVARVSERHRSIVATTSVRWRPGVVVSSGHRTLAFSHVPPALLDTSTQFEDIRIWAAQRAGEHIRQLRWSTTDRERRRGGSS